MYIKIHDGLPGGLACEGCEEINSLNWAEKKVSPLSPTEALITEKAICRECGFEAEWSWEANWTFD